jgi:hypothetical protein
MKDSEARALLLRGFYEKRRAGWLGLGVDTGNPLEFDDRIPQGDVVHLAVQLGEAGLIEWNPAIDHRGNPFAGVGKITALGIDVIDGTQDSPIPLLIDQSSHIQHINISGQHGGVQVSGAHSSQQQNLTHEIERLVSAINSSNVSAGEKEEAKSKLGDFLKTSAAGAIVGQGIGALLKLCGL